MPTCSILQIGDIHYPLYSQEKIIDDKMSSGSRLLSGLAISPFAKAMQFISAMVKTVRVDFAAFVGDFTDGGNTVEFEKSLEFFSEAFKSIGVRAYGVPGNHDLQWSQILEKDYDKFSNFKKITDKYNDRIKLSFDNIKMYDCTVIPDNSISLYAFNSCIGCSDIWKMEKLYSVDIESHLRNIDKDEIYSRFDAPYIDQESVNVACSEIKSNPDTIPIILAHHNILPQRTPRIAIFPEMLNAGYVRSELKNLGRPILYLHGHIHDSLVDSLLADDEDNQVSIVAISAPLFRDGFNHVQLFTSDDRVPLGVQIDEYRYDMASISTTKRRRIRFYNDRKQKRLLDDEATQILAKMEPGKWLAFRQLSEECSPDKLLELEFTDHVEIDRPVKFNNRTWRVIGK